MGLAAGLIAGLCTGLLHTKIRIAPLLAGILMMIALYSINLRVMGGKSMLSLLRIDTVFTDIARLGIPKQLAVMALGLAFIIIICYLMFVFLQTEVGLALRATGDNEQMIRSLGVNTNYSKVVGLALGNGLVGLSGALVAQYQSFSDAGMGIGMIVVGLASVIMGEVVIGNKTLRRTLIAVVIGSIIYRIVITFVMRIGLPATDLKLFTAVLVILAMAMPIVKEKLPAGKASER
jgi:putative ABC transport system permease protein